MIYKKRLVFRNKWVVSSPSGEEYEVENCGNGTEAMIKFLDQYPEAIKSHGTKWETRQQYEVYEIDV